ncbi:MAG: hypothetical protein ACR2K3_07260 [Nocardioides sp.]
MTGRRLTDASGGREKYDDLIRLAELFDKTGEDMRERARLGAEILRDEAVLDSEPLSRSTFGEAADDIRVATSGRNGLLTRSIELDADALVVRATVLTYRWIDELQDAAYQTLGSIAGRAIGYLAPGVALGGAIVSAGLIETDALDRDGVAEYLSELAENNPDLMDHLTSGGGGLLDSLQMRSLLTAGVLAGEGATLVAQGGLRAVGLAPFAEHTAAAVRDVAGEFVQGHLADDAAAPIFSDRVPHDLEALMAALVRLPHSVSISRVAAGRYLVLMPGPQGGHGSGLRLVSGDTTPYAESVVAAIESAVGDDPDARVMLVGAAQGGVAAAELAAGSPSARFTIEQVVTAGAPSAQVPRIPPAIRVLSLEDSSDPVALLGSLVNADSTNRVTVVFDGSETSGQASYVAGGRAADDAGHAEIEAELDRIRSLGYLAGGSSA